MWSFGGIIMAKNKMIFLNAAKTIAECKASGTEYAFICNNLRTDDETLAKFRDLFKYDANDIVNWAVTIDDAFNELPEKDRAEAAKEVRLTILTLMHEMQKTGDL